MVESQRIEPFFSPMNLAAWVSWFGSPRSLSNASLRALDLDPSAMDLKRAVHHLIWLPQPHLGDEEHKRIWNVFFCQLFAEQTGRKVRYFPFVSPPDADELAEVLLDLAEEGGREEFEDDEVGGREWKGEEEEEEGEEEGTEEEEEGQEDDTEYVFVFDFWCLEEEFLAAGISNVLQAVAKAQIWNLSEGHKWVWTGGERSKTWKSLAPRTQKFCDAWSPSAVASALRSISEFDVDILPNELNLLGDPESFFGQPFSEAAAAAAGLPPLVRPLVSMTPVLPTMLQIAVSPETSSVASVASVSSLSSLSSPPSASPSKGQVKGKEEDAGKGEDVAVTLTPPISSGSAALDPPLDPSPPEPKSELVSACLVSGGMETRKGKEKRKAKGTKGKSKVSRATRDNAAKVDFFARFRGKTPSPGIRGKETNMGKTKKKKAKKAKKENKENKEKKGKTIMATRSGDPVKEKEKMAGESDVPFSACFLTTDGTGKVFAKFFKTQTKEDGSSSSSTSGSTLTPTLPPTLPPTSPEFSETKQSRTRTENEKGDERQKLKCENTLAVMTESVNQGSSSKIHSQTSQTSHTSQISSLCPPSLPSSLPAPSSVPVPLFSLFVSPSLNQKKNKSVMQQGARTNIIRVPNGQSKESKESKDFKESKEFRKGKKDKKENKRAKRRRRK